jgi:hypothetical protein
VQAIGNLPKTPFHFCNSRDRMSHPDGPSSAYRQQRSAMHAAQDHASEAGQLNSAIDCEID